MNKPVTKKRVPIDFTAEELVQLDWLKTETKRTRTGAIKWAVDKVAKEHGYLPSKTGD